jgi:hypothetical protein
LILLTPYYVYAGGPDDAVDCYKVGVNNGNDGAFHYGVFDRPYFSPAPGEHEYNPYYKGFIDGCKDAGNSEETCERFSDE